MFILNQNVTKIAEYSEIRIHTKLKEVWGSNIAGDLLLGKYNTADEAEKVILMIADALEKGEKLFKMPLCGML